MWDAVVSIGFKIGNKVFSYRTPYNGAWTEKEVEKEIGLLFEFRDALGIYIDHDIEMFGSGEGIYLFEKVSNFCAGERLSYINPRPYLKPYPLPVRDWYKQINLFCKQLEDYKIKGKLDKICIRGNI